MKREIRFVNPTLKKISEILSGKLNVSAFGWRVFRATEGPWGREG